MAPLKLWAILLVFSVTCNHLSATPEERGPGPRVDTQVDKRACNTATCTTHRLASFLVRSSHSLGAVPPPTNVGANTYGKRSWPGAWAQGPLDHLPL